MGNKKSTPEKPIHPEEQTKRYSYQRSENNAINSVPRDPVNQCAIAIKGNDTIHLGKYRPNTTNDHLISTRNSHFDSDEETEEDNDNDSLEDIEDNNLKDFRYSSALLML